MKLLFFLGKFFPIYCSFCSMDALLIILFLHVTLQVVFGCGDGLCATTLTANGGFVRAAIHQVCEEGREGGREGGRERGK